MHGVGSGAFANRRKPSSSAGDIPQGAIMSTSITHETATTKFAEADGVNYAYRRRAKRRTACLLPSLPRYDGRLGPGDNQRLCP
jgi:hypothetical protein